MTEADWLSSTDPLELLALLSPDFYDSETLRLTVECVTRAADLQTEAMKAWAEAALLVANEDGDPEILEELEEQAFESVRNEKHSPTGYAALDVFLGCWRPGELLYSEDVDGQDEVLEEKAHQANLVRHHFGNPFDDDYEGV